MSTDQDQDREWQLVIHRALMVVTRAPLSEQAEAIKKAKAMLDSGAKRRYTGNQSNIRANTQSDDLDLKFNRAAKTRPTRLNRRGKSTESR